MPDQRDVTEVAQDRQALGGLIRSEDVLELLESDRRAVAEVNPDRLEPMLVRQGLEPVEVFLRELSCVKVESLPRGLVVVRVVHPPCDCSVVVSKNGHLGNLADDICTFVRAAAVPDDVTEAVVDVDVLAGIRVHHRGHGLQVGVDVAEYAEPHRFAGYPECSMVHETSGPVEVPCKASRRSKAARFACASESLSPCSDAVGTISANRCLSLATSDLESDARPNCTACKISVFDIAKPKRIASATMRRLQSSKAVPGMLRSSNASSIPFGVLHRSSSRRRRKASAPLFASDCRKNG